VLCDRHEGHNNWTRHTAQRVAWSGFRTKQSPADVRQTKARWEGRRTDDGGCIPGSRTFRCFSRQRRVVARAGSVCRGRLLVVFRVVVRAMAGPAGLGRGTKKKR
jgi:hypothetical protein